MMYHFVLSIVLFWCKISEVKSKWNYESYRMYLIVGSSTNSYATLFGLFLNKLFLYIHFSCSVNFYPRF